MKRIKQPLTLLSVILVFALAMGLRLRAVERLPIDYDEDDYLAAAQRYAQAIVAGDIAAVVDYHYNYEHPPLSKIVYGLVIAPLPPAPLLPESTPELPPAGSLPQPQFRTARLTAAALGALQVLALAALDPLAGLLLAIFTWQIKYTSQIMLEPLPSLAITLTVLAYAQAVRTRAGRRRTGWLLLSALALGMAEAGKYTYGVAAVAIVVDWVWRAVDGTWHGADRPGVANPRLKLKSGLSRWIGAATAAFQLEPADSICPVADGSPPLRARLSDVGKLLPWGLVALAAFVALDPALWADPLGRLRESLLYHGSYAQSAAVRQANFPIWQPLVWLAQSVPWHPGVFLVALDLPITLLAALGFRRLWTRRRVFALWLAIGLAFLLIWPTKWPQYVLTITPPLALAAAEGARGFLWEPLLRLLRRRGERSADAQTVRGDLRRALPWLLPGALALSIIALFPLLYQAAMSLTDFNTASIRDGIQGGVWRAVWQGLTGQETPVSLGILRGGSRAGEVHYAGPGLLIQILGGGMAELLVFNVLWVVLSIVAQGALGIGAALLLERRGLRLRRLWRTILILPWAIPEFVGALIWLRIFEPDYGWLALSYRLPQGAAPPNPLANPNTTLLILLVAATWFGFPLIMLAATAALKAVPDEVYDAAAMDGAGGWALFRRITWPLLLPLVAPALIIRAIFAFNQFYLFWAMRTSPPLMTFATVSYYVFSPMSGFGGQFAVSAAINIFTVLVLFGLILWFNRWSRAAEGVTYV